jgi:hypothetical protein
MTTTTVDTQQLTVTPCQPSTTTWSTIGNQFIPLSQPSETQSFQQIRPQMDVLLSQNYRQSSQLSSQLSTQNTTQSDFIIPNTQNDDLINKLSSKSYTTLNSLQPTVDTIDNSVFTANNININSNTNTNNNNNNITDEVMEKFDSLGLDIDTSELLSDINFNSMSIMSVMLDSGPNINLSLNSRDNLVSSTLQTPQPLDLNEESTRNLMGSPQQMQRLQNKLMLLETNNNNNNNNNSNNNNNDIQRMD